MPKLEVSKAVRGRKKVKSFKRQLYHDVLYDVLRPVRRAQEAGGFYASLRGR